MLKIIKNGVRDLCVMCLFCVGAVMAGHEANAKEPKVVFRPIAVAGETVDHKYKTYKLEGELDDTRYFANGVVYNTEDLTKQIPFITPAEFKSGVYQCGFICRDPVSKNVVGLNPNYAWLYKKK